MSGPPAIALARGISILPGGLGAAQAQAPAPATPAGVPEAMPFDIPYGTSIDLDTAHKAITAAAAEAKKHNWKMKIAVVGPIGQLVANATMDGTQFASIDIAQAKRHRPGQGTLRRPSKACRCDQRRCAGRAQPAGV